MNSADPDLHCSQFTNISLYEASVCLYKCWFWLDRSRMIVWRRFQHYFSYITATVSLINVRFVQSWNSCCDLDLWPRSMKHKLLQTLFTMYQCMEFEGFPSKNESASHDFVLYIHRIVTVTLNLDLGQWNKNSSKLSLKLTNVWSIKDFRPNMKVLVIMTSFCSIVE